MNKTTAQKRKNKIIHQVYNGESIHLYSGENMLISYSNSLDREELTKIERKTFGGDTREIASWGEDNLLPQKREEILRDNNIVPELISTKRGITLGQGLIAYKVEFKDGKKVTIPVAIPDEVQEWLDNTNWDDYIIEAGGEFFKHFNVFTEFIRNKNKKIRSIKIRACKRIRSGKQDNTGRVKKYYWHGSWDEGNEATGKQKAKEIPAYIKGEVIPKFILHLGDPLFFDGYYFYPPYWGGKEWIELSNIIPKFHKANMGNGYSIRFHIEIPKDYFAGKAIWNTAEEQKKELDKANQREQEFIDKMNSFLAGVDNAGRAVYTKYDVNVAIGKEFPGIKIHTITPDLKDEALLKLFEKSNDANISAQGIHPTLAAIQTQGKLSSGSEIRNALLLYISIKTALPRKILLKPLEIVKKINGWPKDIFYTFEDIEITKLDEDKSGTQNVIENQQVDE